MYCHWSFEIKEFDLLLQYFYFQNSKTFIDADKTAQSGVLSKLSKDEYVNKRLPKCTSVMLIGKNYRPVQSES